jgi:choline-sulfatase
MIDWKNNFEKLAMSSALGVMCLANGAENKSKTENDPRGNSMKYNVLLIMSDEHTGTMMGCAGHPVVKTPNIDTLAANGVMFANAYCNNPLCVPSRASFMTGQLVHRTKAWENSGSFSSEMVTMAHIMRNANYQAHLAGKMHFIGEDQLHGFNTHKCEYLPELNKIEYKHLFQTDWNNHIPGEQGSLNVPRPHRKKKKKTEFIPYVTEGEVHKFYPADQTTHEEAVSFIDKFNPETEAPFFYVASYHLPHFPFKPDKKYYDRYKNIVDNPATGADVNWPEALEYWKIRSSTDKDLIKKKRAAYYGLITQFDKHVGNLVKTLKKNGLYDNTLIIYCSDHGEMAGERGLFMKSVFYENSVRVPLIFSCPSLFKGGRKITDNVSLVDVLPTLQEFAKVKYDGPLDGQSLWGTITGKRQLKKERPIFCDYYGYGTPSPGRMVRIDNWKLSFYHGYKDAELYNLEKDPNELNNLHDNSDFKEIKEKLYKAALKDWNGEALMDEIKRNHHQRKFMIETELNSKPVLTKRF